MSRLPSSPRREKDFRSLTFPSARDAVEQFLPLGFFHDENPVRPVNHLRGKEPGPVPRAVDAFLPQDGNGLGIGIGAPEIEKACRLRLHVR